MIHKKYRDLLHEKMETVKLLKILGGVAIAIILGLIAGMIVLALNNRS